MVGDLHMDQMPHVHKNHHFSHTHMYFFKTTNLLYSGWSRYNLRTNYFSLLSSMLCPTNHRVFLLSASLSVYFFVAGTSFASDALKTTSYGT